MAADDACDGTWTAMEKDDGPRADGAGAVSLSPGDPP